VFGILLAAPFVLEIEQGTYYYNDGFFQ